MAVMRVMVLENKKLRNVVPVDGGALSIGSSPTCTVHLPDPRISAEQAKCVQDETGSWWLEIVDASIPTCLNRAVQKGRARLRHADEIEMGIFSIRLFIDHQNLDELRKERLTELTRHHGESLPLDTITQKFENLTTVGKDQIMEATILALRLSQTDSPRELIPILLRALIRLLNARRAWVGIRRPDQRELDWEMALGVDGQPCERPVFSTYMEDRCLSKAQFLACPEVPAESVRSAMAAPLLSQGATIGMLYVENGNENASYTREWLDVLSAIASAVAPPIETVIRKSMAKRLAVTTSEHTIARATQDAVTPRALPQWNELQVAAYRHMGSLRCCDYYDVVQLPDKTCAVIVAKLLVDGAAVTRYMSEVRAAFRSSALHCDAPHLFARSLNWLLTGDPRYAVDLVAAWIAPASGKVNYCVAGRGVHLGVVYPDGKARKLDTKRSESIGRVKSPALELQTLDLGHGHTLGLVTSGVHLAVNAAGDKFGLSGVEEALCDALGDAPGQVLSELAADISTFLEDGNCPEDLSIMLIRRT